MRQKFVLANFAVLFYFRYLHIMSEMKLFLTEELRFSDKELGVTFKPVFSVDFKQWVL